MRLIDADALKKDILGLPDCYNGFSDTYDKACIIGVIDEQPIIRAQPEQKRGKWIESTELSEQVKGKKFCSNCGKAQCFIEITDKTIQIKKQYKQILPRMLPENGGMSVKIRLTILTENDKQRPQELTEEKVKSAWQSVVSAMCLMSGNDDTCVVEKVEFVEEES